MKRIILSVLLALIAQTIKAQADAFITTWVTTTGFETITLAAQPDAPNYTINWGDGYTNTYTATQVPSHTFITSGEHMVSFTGTFPHLMFVGQTKLKAVQQWGTQKWTSMANMFAGCSTLNTCPTQAPDLNLCTSMASMFNSAKAFNQPIGSWNVSNVTNMSWMFEYATAFNQPIGSWNVSSVINMQGMFYSSKSGSAFNQPIGSWDVSNVTNMSYMFEGATAFNQPLGSWNVSKVTDMSRMFFAGGFQMGSAFNQPIGSWNVSNVTNMSVMFEGATAFNQPLGSWNVSNVTNMSYMFSEATAFNQAIGSWDVGNVTNMGNMFLGAKLSTANYDTTLIGWATRGINGGVLKSGVTFNGGNSNYCNSLGARNYLTNTYGWQITDAGLNCNEIILDTNGVTIKYTGTTVPSPYFIQASPRGVLEWFAIVDNSTKSNISDYAKNIQSGKTYFTPTGSSTPIPFNNIVTTLVTDMSYMFTYSTSTNFSQTNLLFNQNIGSWDVSNVTNMGCMFQLATAFNQNISSWNVSNVTNMESMFYQATTFNQPLGSWNVSNVTNMGVMFGIASAFNQPIGSWNVSQVTNMFNMFTYATAFNQAISSWDVSSVSTMQAMFNGATAFNQNISSWDVSKVTSMSWMFRNATAFNQPIGSWDVSNVTTMYVMFLQATSFNQPIGSWDVSNVTNMSGMFTGAGLSTTNYDALLIGWATRGTNGGTLKTNVQFSAGNSKYCNGKDARNYLISTYGWTITDGGLDCSSLIVLDANGVTLKYTGTTVPSTYLIQASPRGTLEWFAIVDNNTKSNITNYAKNVASGKTYFTPTGSSTPIPFDNIVTTLVTDMSEMFFGCKAFNQNIESWDVSKVTSMDRMFAFSPFNQPIGNWNVINVTNMSAMFDFSLFNQPIGNWNVSNVTNMSAMFYASSFSQPIGNWNVSNVTNMSSMFAGGSIFSSFNQPIGNWNVSNVTNMYGMFSGSPFNQPIGNWNVSNVTNMSYLFNFSPFNQPIDNWNVSNVTNMSSMFAYSPFNQPIGNWNVSNVNTMSEMFTGAKLSTANYDATLIGWATKGTDGSVLKQGVIFDGGYSMYCNGLGARNFLKNTYGWIITDAGLNCTGLGTEAFDKSSVSLYPNPTLGLLNIKVDENLTNQPYTITDALGKVVLKGKLNEGDTNINVEHLSKGIYYIKISNNKASKFIKE